MPIWSPSLATNLPMEFHCVEIFNLYTVICNFRFSHILHDYCFTLVRIHTCIIFRLHFSHFCKFGKCPQHSYTNGHPPSPRPPLEVTLHRFRFDCVLVLLVIVSVFTLCTSVRVLWTSKFEPYSWLT